MAMGFRDRFRHFAQGAARAVGTPWAFLLAVAVIIGWVVSGPIFSFSDTWQLIINTGTTIVTFLMVFLIQHMQNRDAQAIHVKLDELIKGTRSARNAVIDLEDASDEELEAFRQEFLKYRRNKSSK